MRRELKTAAEDGRTAIKASKHTRRKLEVLQRYFQGYAWIILQNFPGFIYIDAHAGPGINVIDGNEYEGSPLLALKTFVKVACDLLSKDMVNGQKFIKIYLIEEDREAYEALIARVINYVKKLREESAFTSLRFEKKADTTPLIITIRKQWTSIRIEIYVWRGDCNAKLGGEFIKQVQDIPCLLLIDPFGFKDWKWDTAMRIAQIRRIDVVFTFQLKMLKRRSDTQAFNEFFGPISGWCKEVLRGVKSGAEWATKAHEIMGRYAGELNFKYESGIVRYEDEDIDYFYFIMIMSRDETALKLAKDVLEAAKIKHARGQLFLPEFSRKGYKEYKRPTKRGLLEYVSA